MRRFLPHTHNSPDGVPHTHNSPDGVPHTHNSPWCCGCKSDALLPLPPCPHLLSQIYHNVAAEPTMVCIQEGVKAIEDYKPDIIIGLVGSLARVRGSAVCSTVACLKTVNPYGHTLTEP